VDELEGVFHMVCPIPGELADNSCYVLGELVGMSASVANNMSQRNLLFVYPRKSI
jgi:hypothetical protein